jgi:selenophosphate synthase
MKLDVPARMLLQERNRPSPGQISSFLVVARGVGVVVEGVVGAFVDVDGVGLFGCFIELADHLALLNLRPAISLWP